jgi:hypothetical protein
MPGIGEAWFEIGVPVEKIQADMERAHQIARTQADKIQQAITQTMEKARVVPPAMRSPTFVAAMGSDPNFDYYAYGGGAQGTRTRAGDRDFAFRETRARQNLRNIMQEMVAFEQAQAIGVLDSSPAATPQGGQGGRAPASGRRTPFAFRGLEGVSRFGEMAGPAVGVFAGLAGARFAGDIFSNAEQQRADFVQRTGRLPGPGEIPGGTSKEFDYGVPVIGHLIRAADQFSDWFHDKSALEELSKATEAGTVNMLATGKALDVMARSMQAGADITSATSDVQKARIKAELDYKETIEKARDALGNVPKGMSPDDWLTVMAPRARAVEEAAAAQRFSAIDAATKGQYGAVAGFLNTETDPEDACGAGGGFGILR